MIHLKEVRLPECGIEQVLPEISLTEYQQRLTETCKRMKQAGLDVLVVYGDREHFANLAYLTGFDPRFEEALLLMDTEGGLALLVGNECMGYLPDPRLGCKVVLFQEFSLLGQPRDSSDPLRQIFADFGIGHHSTVGCVGWKYFEDGLIEHSARAIEIPSYFVDLLRDLTGDPMRVSNASSLFMNPTDGLRIINSADQIAQFEFASIRTSESILNVLKHLREGVAERDLEPLLDGAGLPLSCHRMISFGAKAKRGLASPSNNCAKLGDAFTVCIGVTGALTSRAGAIARGPEDLPADLRDFYPKFAANYFDVVATWYQHVKIGAKAGDVFAVVEAKRDPSLYDFAVNPGHYLHLDEWVHSPFSDGSEIALRSGMALQMDIIPISKGPFCYSNAEDGIALAEEKLRSELAQRYPGCWQRIGKRREFMQEALGLKLDESVLPLSNIPGWLAPYVLRSELALVAQ